MLKEIKEDIYRLLHPKLTFFLTSIGRDGRPNVMTCAWATPVSEDPPIIMVSISKESYTSTLIMETGEFNINIPHKDLIRALWITGRFSGRDTDKFQKAKLKILKAKKTSVPLIEGCIGYIECSLLKTVEAGECYAFFGDVLYASVDTEYFRKRLWTPQAELPLHLGGSKIVHIR